MNFKLTIIAASIQELVAITNKLNDTPAAITISGHNSVTTPQNQPIDFTHQPAHVPHLPPQPEAEVSTADVSGQYDSSGLPWDERIHSSSKKKTAAGIWTRRKNVAEAQFLQISAELRNSPVQPYVPPVTGGLVNTPQTYPTAPAFDPNVGFNPATQSYAAPVQPPAQTYPQAPAAPVQTINNPPAGGYTIQDLFTRLQNMYAKGGVDPAYVPNLLNLVQQRFGVPVAAIPDMTTRPDMIAFVLEQMTFDGK